MDGFILTHVIEPVEFWEKEQVERYLPVFKPVHALHPDKPVTMGGVGMPYIYSEAKVAQDEPLIQAKGEIITAWKELGDIVGRYYNPVETYKSEDAETLFITQGSYGETVSMVVDALRDEGKSVGLVMDRLWRPFPFDEFREAVKTQRTLSLLTGPYLTEVRAVPWQSSCARSYTRGNTNPISRILYAAWQEET